MALPFGALAAVWGYGRVAGSVCHILQRLFSVPQSAYVDDFMRGSPRRWAALLQWIFKEVHCMLGIPLKDEKNQGPAARLEVLGMEIAATSQWAALRLTDARRETLQAAVDGALRARALSTRDAQRLGGQLGFASTGLFGRVGRAYAPIVSYHKGGWSPALQHALESRGALLQFPLHHYREHACDLRRAMAWVDGSWDMADATGGVGAVLFVRGSGQWSMSAHIPQALCSELTQYGKEQRNTQSELLAILMLLLSKPEELRGAFLEIWEDNTAALYNTLAGSAADDQSRELVAAIWLIAAVLRLSIWIGYVPSPSNCADPFSRPNEAPKQMEAAQLSREFKLVQADPVLPASVRTAPATWAATIQAARAPGQFKERAAQARLAAQLGVAAVDSSTVQALLERVSFTAQNAEVTFGWVELRRKGIAGAATAHHADLTRVLCEAFRQRCPGQRCTTIVLAAGNAPASPTERRAARQRCEQET